jgi:predicted deacylase
VDWADLHGDRDVASKLGRWDDFEPLFRDVNTHGGSDEESSGIVGRKCHKRPILWTNRNKAGVGTVTMECGGETLDGEH